jgi:F0F1-type ATP synthase membrane subunit b/b'
LAFRGKLRADYEEDKKKLSGEYFKKAQGLIEAEDIMAETVHDRAIALTRQAQMALEKTQAKADEMVETLKVKEAALDVDLDKVNQEIEDMKKAAMAETMITLDQACEKADKAAKKAKAKAIAEAEVEIKASRHKSQVKIDADRVKMLESVKRGVKREVTLKASSEIKFSLASPPDKLVEVVRQYLMGLDRPVHKVKLKYRNGVQRGDKSHYHQATLHGNVELICQQADFASDQDFAKRGYRWAEGVVTFKGQVSLPVGVNVTICPSCENSKCTSKELPSSSELKAMAER